jgi:hypothetical protein
MAVVAVTLVGRVALAFILVALCRRKAAALLRRIAVERSQETAGTEGREIVALARAEELEGQAWILAEAALAILITAQRQEMAAAEEREALAQVMTAGRGELVLTRAGTAETLIQQQVVRQQARVGLAETEAEALEETEGRALIRVAAAEAERQETLTLMGVVQRQQARGETEGREREAGTAETEGRALPLEEAMYQALTTAQTLELAETAEVAQVAGTEE